MQNNSSILFSSSPAKVRKWVYDFCYTGILDYFCRMSFLDHGDLSNADRSLKSALQNFARAKKIYPQIEYEYPRIEWAIAFAQDSRKLCVS
jgi:hypothetical protein